MCLFICLFVFLAIGQILFVQMVSGMIGHIWFLVRVHLFLLAWFLVIFGLEECMARRCPTPRVGYTWLGAKLRGGVSGLGKKRACK